MNPTPSSIDDSPLRECLGELLDYLTSHLVTRAQSPEFESYVNGFNDGLRRALHHIRMRAEQEEFADPAPSPTVHEVKVEAVVARLEMEKNDLAIDNPLLKYLTEQVYVRAIRIIREELSGTEGVCQS